MRSPSSNLRRARPLLGTLVEITVSADFARANDAIDCAFAAIERVHALMSFQDAGSDVARLNRAALAAPVAVDAHTFAVLALAARVALVSDGAFDITVAPVLIGLGLLPAAGHAPPAHRRRGFELIELLPGERVRFHAPLAIDLGGIAKGYAVDLAAATLEQAGVDAYVVNAGGDLRVGSAAERIHVRHPARPARLLELASIRCAAVATSAPYFAARDTGDSTRHPVIAPETGAPASYCGSISVLAASCATADALTKVVAVLGRRAIPVLRHFEADACLLSVRGGWRRWTGHASRRHAPRRRATDCVADTASP